MTQACLAQHLGVTSAAISNIEQGARSISGKMAIKLYRLDPDAFPFEKTLVKEINKPASVDETA